mmetsp:Transcript_1671/g.4319  ORF Transcript_1671/g.4319 Transcript_1671/m.4319 type:complete len:302 (+) Transcript_1671:1031-1936(+)
MPRPPRRTGTGHLRRNRRRKSRRREPLPSMCGRIIIIIIIIIDGLGGSTQSTHAYKHTLTNTHRSILPTEESKPMKGSNSTAAATTTTTTTTAMEVDRQKEEGKILRAPHPPQERILRPPRPRASRELLPTQEDPRPEGAERHQDAPPPHRPIPDPDPRHAGRRRGGRPDVPGHPHGRNPPSAEGGGRCPDEPPGIGPRPRLAGIEAPDDGLLHQRRRIHGGPGGGQTGPRRRDLPRQRHQRGRDAPPDRRPRRRGAGRVHGAPGNGARPSNGGGCGRPWRSPGGRRGPRPPQPIGPRRLG